MLENRKFEVDVTIVIPVYNAENYLRNCLESVKDQSLHSIEVICINDGSSDKSGYIIDEFCSIDSRFVKIEISHSGAGYARNIGLEAARGKYITFLDADDYYELNMIEDVWNKAEEKNLEICIWGAVEIDEISGEKKVDNCYLRRELCPNSEVFSGTECDYLFNMTSGVSWNKIFLVSFLRNRNIKFMEINSYNDLSMTYIALLSAKKISYIDNIYTNYRINNEFSLQGMRERTISDAFLAFEKIWEYMNQYKLADGRLVKSFKNYIFSCLYFVLLSSHNKETIEKIKTFLSTNIITMNSTYDDIFGFNRQVWIDIQKILKCNNIDDLEIDPNKRIIYKDEIKISVIVPTFNDEKTVERCLDSLASQKLQGVEFIIVDDCSYDNTYNILLRYAENDKRFNIMRHEKNLSAFQARKDGVLKARGQYVMFVDADDFLTENACQILWELEDVDSVDILHYGTNIITDIDDESRIQKYKDLIDPSKEELKDQEIFLSFINRDFEGHLWNKIFYRELALFAISKAKDEILPKGQDKYFYWMMAYYAKSYKGCPDYTLYNYCYGLGVEGKETYEIEEFEIFCKQAWTENAIERFMHDEAQDYRYEDVLKKSRRNLLRHTIRHLEKLNYEDRSKGVNLLRKYWNNSGDTSEIVAALCDFYKKNQKELADILCEAKFVRPTKISTIGTFYHIYNNGGIQRVIGKLMEIWVQTGYKVIFFTDYPETENDYVLPEGVKRVTLALNGNSAEEQYYERGKSFESLLKEYNVDIMVYHEYFGRSMIWDMILSKFMGIPFIIYYHNVFSKFIATYEKQFFTIPKVAKLADAIVALSEIDRDFWMSFNQNVFVVKNPLVFDFANTRPSCLKRNIIVWVGRLDEFHKRFEEPIDMMKILLKKVPDAKLLLVGKDSDCKNFNKLKARIEKLHMEDAIILCGFQKDVTPFYEMASVYLMTSRFEGYPMTLVEALTFGLPAVMYEIPYLTLVKDNEGIIAVPQGNTDLLSNAVAELLLSYNLRKKKGIAARYFIENLYKTENLNKEWQTIFDSVLNENINNNNRNILIETIVEHFEISYENNMKEFRYYRRTIDSLKNNLELIKKGEDYQDEIGEMKEAEFYKYQLEETRKSITYKVGRTITFIPRWIRHIIFKKPM